MMRQHELALSFSRALSITGERFASYDAFVAGYDAALSDLKMPARPQAQTKDTQQLCQESETDIIQATAKETTGAS